jgi:hypothetical protein
MERERERERVRVRESESESEIVASEMKLRCSLLSCSIFCFPRVAFWKMRLCIMKKYISYSM